MSDEDYLNSLRLKLDELRRTDDQTNNDFDQLRMKSLAMIAGVLALATFIFSSDSLRIPHEYYGCIFFFLGVGLFVGSLGMLLWTVGAAEWKTPGNAESPQRLRTDNANYVRYLERVIDDYNQAVTDNIALVTKRSKRFNWALYLLALSSMMLLTMKFGGA